MKKVAVNGCGAYMNSGYGSPAWCVPYDSATGRLEAHENAPSAAAPQGAGIKAAETVSQLGAEVVITGHCGPKAFRTLRAAGIRVALCAEGTAAEAIDRFQSGRLECANSPDVEGHW